MPLDRAVLNALSNGHTVHTKPEARVRVLQLAMWLDHFDPEIIRRALTFELRDQHHAAGRIAVSASGLAVHPAESPQAWHVARDCLLFALVHNKFQFVQYFFKEHSECRISPANVRPCRMQRAAFP